MTRRHRRRRNPAVSVSTIEALISRNYSGLRLLIQRRTGDPELAADLLNDAVCTTWEKWQAGQIERPELIAGYIFQVAMNLLRNQRRKLGERPERRATTDQLDALIDPDSARDRALEESIAARVRRLLRSMTTPRDRLVLTRFYLEEVDKESICRELGLEPLQFDKILHRGAWPLAGTGRIPGTEEDGSVFGTGADVNDGYWRLQP